MPELDPNLVRNLNHIPDTIRLVDLDKTWIAKKREVLDRLQETSLDLYLLNDDATPPVYKILDYGRYKFDKQKKEREQKKKLRDQARPIKEFKFKPGIDDHDVEVKTQHICANLPEHDIKICVELKSRNGNRHNLMVLTNRWQRTIYEVVNDPQFVLNKVVEAVGETAQPIKLTITDNQIFGILKYNMLLHTTVE